MDWTEKRLKVDKMAADYVKKNKILFARAIFILLPFYLFTFFSNFAADFLKNS